ncbi:MAG: tetratricopeptide repeat protein [Terriglobia bacterium]
MRSQTIKHVIRFLMPRILAVAVAVFWAVGAAQGAEAKLNQVSDTVIEITGGSGKDAWRLSYGTLLQGGFKPHFVSSEVNRAWYSYGGWVRLIDTQKGVVLGRWHYPGEIINLTPEGMKIQIETEDKLSMEQVFHRKFELDPSDPHVPFWPTGFLMLYPVSLNEGRMLWPSVINVVAPGKISTEEAKKILPELEDAVRRDAFTPWFRIGLGRVLRDLGDPRATEEFQEAIKTPGADFTELLPISTYLDAVGENDLARAAFERGYQDFWQKGNDPRMLWALIDFLMIYRPTGGDWGNPATPHGRELIERAYRLTPDGEAAWLAWRLYANYLSAQGSPEESRLWRERADVAFQNSFGLFGEGVDSFTLLALASALAVGLYAFALYVRYRPQSRLDRASHKRATGFSRIAAFLNAQYWSRQERFAFLTVVLVGWFSVGLTAEGIEAILRRAWLPIGSAWGNLAGPVTIAGLENGLPATPERDLLLAVAFQQDGQLDKAEHLYRRLPQFAESWNNLGMILKEAGKDHEAKTAFEKALELDPKLAEAALNLGRPARDFWTEQHQKYLPGQPMIAPPLGPRLRTACLGGSKVQVYLRALEGPFVAGPLGSLFHLLGKLYG